MRLRDHRARLLLRLPCRRVGDQLANGQLARPLADLSDVRAGKAFRQLGVVVEVDVVGERTLARGGLQDGEARLEVRQRKVHKLVEPSRPHHCRVEHVGTVGGGNDKHALLRAHPIDLCQDLVDDPVAGIRTTAGARASWLGDRVDLVEEEDAWRRASRLVEELTDVRLGLAEPHREQLGPLHRDEVGVALIRYRFGQQGLATAGRTIEEHTL
mmetsp:Transcript_24441/g.51881  ORF Transcript_24441/g.51881 Transcript_24441/m.51881 type:complete len:213 (+) Transcript_24441:718-1356(+)